MTTKTKLITIFSTLACFFVSASLLICFFAFKPKAQSAEAYLQVTDLQLAVGQYAELDMNMSQDTSVVKCETMDQKIAVIDNGYVYGVSKGTTYVKVEVKYKDEKISKIAQIVVNDDESIVDTKNYEFLISSNDNCEYKNGVLYYKEGASFLIEFTGLGWGNIFNITFSSKLNFRKELGKYIISDNKNGYIYFTSCNEIYTFALRCEYDKNLL